MDNPCKKRRVEETVVVTVSSISGDLSLEHTTLTADQKVAELYREVQAATGKHVRALVSASGSILLPGNTVRDTELRTGDIVTAVFARPTRIFSTRSAFAAVKGDGTVVTWGDAREGGDSRAVQEQLSGGDVQQIFSTRAAFAAL